jgi:hypothetical protein
VRKVLCGFVTTLAVVAALASTAQAATMTVATFADPTTTSSTPLFTFNGAGSASATDPTGSTLSGSWLFPGLNLLFSPNLALSAPNATFDTGTLTATSGTVGGFFDVVVFGNDDSFTFLDSSNNPYLTFSWDNAFLTNNGFGGTLAFNGIAITVPAGSPLTGYTFSTPETMTFSFANASGEIGTAVANNQTITWTASFTSSADVAPPDTGVPEPASMLLLGTGLVGIGARLRRRAKRA